MFFATVLVFAGASMVFAASSSTTPPNSTIDWCALCQDGKMWDPYTEDCIDCGKDGTATYDLTTCACSCNDPMRVYVPGSGCVPSFDWCSFNCKEGVWDPVTHSCSGNCDGEGQRYDEETCECACDDGVYNPTTRKCEPDPKLCNGKCNAPEFWNEDTKKCEMCVSIPGVSYYDPGACQCRCTQEGYEYDAKTGTCVAEQSYTVSFEANGGTGGQSTNVAATYGQAMPAISTTAPTRTGYTFTGWYDAASGGTRYYDADGTSARNWDKTANTTLYAQWAANTYTISFNANGGTGGQTADVTATYGAAMPAISATAPTRTGYTFAGWYDNATSGTKYYNANGTSARNWDKTANTTLYAQWSENIGVYTIYISYRTKVISTVYDDMIYAYNGHYYSDLAHTQQISAITAANNPSADCLFAGFYDSIGNPFTNASGQFTSYAISHVPTQNTYLYAHYTCNGSPARVLGYNYNCAGDVNNGWWYEYGPTSNFDVSNITDLSGITSTASSCGEFSGWCAHQTYYVAPGEMYDIDASYTSNIEAKWCRTTGLQPNLVAWGPSPAELISMGYTNDDARAALCQNNIGAVKCDAGYKMQASSDGHIVGEFTLNNELVRLWDNCTEAGLATSCTACTNTIPANSHYSASAPTINGNCPWECDNGYVLSNNQCVSQDQCYTITLNNTTNGGTGDTTALYKKLNDTNWYSDSNCTTQVTTLTKPTKTNATYEGHYTSSSDGTQYVTNNGTLSTTWIVAENKTLYAQYDCNENYRQAGTRISGTCAANEHIVSFNANGGSGGQTASVTATYGAAMPAISTTAPTRTGYTFSGWYDNATSGTKYYNADGTSAKNWDKTANTTLYAQWAANTYTISFNANGGTGGQTASVTATYGQAMPAISTTAPTLAGYTFAGWYDASTGGTKYYNANGTSAKNWDKTANTTLYAQWSQDVIECSVGQYYNATSNECATCVAGSYCPGGTLAMGQGNQGIYSCPAAPAYNANTMPWNSSTTATSDAGAGAITECYLAWLPAGCLAQLNAGWNYAGYVLPNVLYSENVKVYCSSAGTYPTGNQYIVPARLLAQPGYEVNQANTYTAPNGSTVTNPWTPPLTKAYYAILGKSCSKCSAGAYSMGGGQMRWQSGTLVENAVCRSCPTGWPNSSAGSDAITKCYSNTKSRAWTGTQEACSNPDATGCSAVTCGTCSNEACSYVAYVNSAGDADGAIKSGCSENNAACTQPVTALTANEGYHIESGNLNYCPANTYTVTFNANGGTGMANPTSVTCAYDQNCTLAAKGTLSKTNATFDGWNTASNGTGTSYLESDVVQNLTSTNGANVTLYAVWRTSGCSAGKYLVDGVCVSCPAGYSCAGGSALPVMCPTNKYSTGGAASCSSCTGGLTTSSVADARYHDEVADCGRILHVGAYEIRLKSIPATGTLSSLVPSPSLRFNYAGNANGRPDFYANMSPIASPMRVTSTGLISTTGSGDKFKTQYNNTNYYVCDDVTCVTE